jgi:RimJ/RimL family protein N-acetyltransferase
VVVVSARALRPGDEAEVDAFLVRFSDTAMFLRGNLRAVGLGWSGAPFEGHWFARVDPAGAIAGIAAHFWNGNLVVQDDAPEDTARAAVAASGLRVAGLIGPRAHVVRARAAIGMTDAPAQSNDEEILMALDLAALRAPDPRGTIARRAELADLAWLVDWRHDYMVEAIRTPAGDATRADARDSLTRSIGRRTLWVLVDDAGAPLATTDFNATLPDVVQVGGVYTPPALRRRGYAQSVVAASLVDARASGVRRAILFTDGANPSSTSAYRKLGFETIGTYALLLF